MYGVRRARLVLGRLLVMILGLRLLILWLLGLLRLLRWLILVGLLGIVLTLGDSSLRLRSSILTARSLGFLVGGILGSGGRLGVQSGVQIVGLLQLLRQWWGRW